MKSKLGIYFGLLFSTVGIVYIASYEASRYSLVSVHYELSASEKQIANSAAFSSVIGTVVGYLLFGVIYLLLNRFTNSVKKSYRISMFVGIFAWGAISILIGHALIFQVHASSSINALFHAGIMPSLLGGLVGLFAITLKFDERFIDSK